MHLRDKMMHHGILMQDPMIAKFLPETIWYNHENLHKMLDRYPVLYLKPNNKSGGEGIIRVKSTGGSNYLITFESTNKNVHKTALSVELDKIILNPKKYIIQQGIELSTYKNKPFDIRIVLQKVYETWRLTLTSAKVAVYSDSIVTNVSKGAKDYLLHEVLEKYDQKQNPMATFREIIDLSHQIATKLGKKIPVRIIGLDLAIDVQGNIWYIESNTEPACEQCLLVNDHISVSKYKYVTKIQNQSKTNKKQK